MFVTGLVSYAAYNPRLGQQRHHAAPGILGFCLFSWVTNPSWVYRVSQGTHVVLGLTLMPILLAKLWSVLPKLFDWPPVRSVAHALERASLLLLVGGAVFQFVTGILNIDYWLRVEVLLLRRAFLRGVGVHRRVRRPCHPQAPGHGPVPAIAPAADRARHSAVGHRSRAP